MSLITMLFDQAQLAQAAYANFLPSKHTFAAQH